MNHACNLTSSRHTIYEAQKRNHDNVCVLQALCKDSRCVPAGGASELEMARQVSSAGAP